jgi:geranylgeranyl reductase family protein
VTLPAADVLIIGLGPAGSGLALRLARRGHRVIAIDRAHFPRDKACSEYLSPEGVRHLAELGVLDAIERQDGRRIRGTTVVAPRGSRLTGLFARAGHRPFRETGLSVARRVLDTALVRAAGTAGAEIREGTTLLELIRTDGGIMGAKVRGPDGRTTMIRARITVGADGLRSRVARDLGPFRQEPIRRWAFVAHVADVLDLSDTAELHVRADGYVGLNPIGSGLANVALVVPARDIGNARGHVDDYFFTALERFDSVRGRVRRARLAREVMVTGPFARRASRVIADGAMLVGDAADFFDPFTGEGICAALRGAAMADSVITGALSAASAAVPASLLGEYLALRRKAFLGKWAVERLIGYGMLAPALFDRAVERLERRGLAHTMIGVTGDFVPARAVLNPAFLARMVM